MSEWAHEIASIEVCHFDTREEAIAAEVAAIKSEKPKYNFMHNRPDKRDDDDDDDCVRLIRRIVELRPAYTVIEAARVLDVSDGTVRGLIKSGQMGSVNIGAGAKSTRITGWQLIDYIESIGGK